MMKRLAEANALRATIRATLLLSLLSAACGPAAQIGPEPNEPGTGAEDQDAAQHRAAAQVESARLERHKELYDPHAKQEIRRCDAGAPGQYPATPICWVETVNPTAVHLKEVEDHRMRAVHHRKAARELQDVEDKACANVAAEDPGPGGLTACTRWLERCAALSEARQALRSQNSGSTMLRSGPEL